MLLEDDLDELILELLDLELLNDELDLELLETELFELLLLDFELLILLELDELPEVYGSVGGVKPETHLAIPFDIRSSSI